MQFALSDESFGKASRVCVICSTSGAFVVVTVRCCSFYVHCYYYMLFALLYNLGSILPAASVLLARARLVVHADVISKAYIISHVIFV